MVRVGRGGARPAARRRMRFARFLWDFVVGDDPLVAAGVVLAVAITALLEVWWLLPLAVLVLLYVSLRRASA
jgi:hypothetical protein